jgi:hypothetical protein
MSHTSTYKETITDTKLFLQSCRKFGEVEEYNQETTVPLFGRNAVQAIAKIKLPGWRYDIALTKSGELKYDHWGSSAGSMEVLHKAMVDYKVETVKKNIPLEAESWMMDIDAKTGDVVMEINF